jgi:hypothetical protein
MFGLAQGPEEGPREMEMEMERRMRGSEKNNVHKMEWKMRTRQGCHWHANEELRGKHPSVHPSIENTVLSWR